eukprot:tig00000198_g16068.t1
MALSFAALPALPALPARLPRLPRLAAPFVHIRAHSSAPKEDHHGDHHKHKHEHPPHLVHTHGQHSPVDLERGFHFRHALGHVPEQLKGASLEGPPAYALVYGWLGARRRHLHRLLSWYEHRGIPTISYIPQPTRLLDFPEAAEDGRHMVSVLTSGAHLGPGGSSAPIVVHALSNGGFISYGYLLSAFEEVEARGGAEGGYAASARSRIRSLVIDSAPEPLSPDLASRGYVGALLGAVRAVQRRMGRKAVGPPRYEAPVLSSVGRSFFSWYLSKREVREEIERVMGLLEHRQPGCSQLYLYSKADRLIDPRAVEEWVERQRAAARPVRSRFWEDSEHVELFKDHAEEYGEELMGHIAACLQGRGAEL